MRTILLFDTDRDAIRHAAALLNGMGYVVEATSDPATAIAVARTRNPSLALIDVGAPSRLGLGLVTALRRRTPWLPVVATAHIPEGSEDTLHMALRAGASDAVLKPLAPLRLRDRVWRLAGPPARTTDRVSRSVLDETHQPGRN